MKTNYCLFGAGLVFLVLQGCGANHQSATSAPNDSSATPEARQVMANAPQQTSSPFIISNAQSGGFGYAYGPSIIYTQGIYHAYFCSAGDGTSTDWDNIRHETSTDMIHWSSPSTILTPSAYERSNCDPSVVLYNAGDGAYYYMFYSGNVQNVQTVNFVARSASPNGPFAKYTSAGTWVVNATNPQVITWPFRSTPDNAASYGAGEPSVVVRNNLLYMWYTDTTNPAIAGAYQYLVTSSDGVHWSVPARTNVSDVSVDVKFNPSLNEYIMAEVTPQLSTSSSFQIRTSLDGVNWSNPNVLCGVGCFPENSSNPGISGDDQGHITNIADVLLGFGSPYTINGPEQWGNWDLWGETYNLASSLPTPPPIAPYTGTVYKMASAQSNNVLSGWPASNAIDGNINSSYSSNHFPTSFNNSNTFLASWLPSFENISTVILTARTAGGVPMAFPASYNIYLTNSSNTSWIFVGTYSIQPYNGVAHVKLPQSYSTIGVQIVPTYLGRDNYNTPYFQLAEIGLGN